MADLSGYSDYELLTIAGVKPPQFSTEYLIHLSRNPSQLFKKPVDTRTFQQYDQNNPTAQRQLQPAADTLAGMMPDVAGTAAAFMGSKPDQDAMLRRMAQGIEQC